jgi:hypothetical protein
MAGFGRCSGVSQWLRAARVEWGRIVEFGNDRKGHRIGTCLWAFDKQRKGSVEGDFGAGMINSAVALALFRVFD